VLRLVGFVSTGLYWPGISGAATTPRWAALFLIVPWLIAGPSPLAATHLWGLGFAGVAALSLLWTPDLSEGINQLFIVGLWASLFLLGREHHDIRPFYTGAIVGLVLSSVVAIIQYFGWHPVADRFPGALPSGLFVNGNYMAEAAALLLIVAVIEGWWESWFALVPALLLPHARGAIVAFVLAMVLYLRKQAYLAVPLAFLLICALIGFVYRMDASSSERLQIWQSTWNGLTIFGHGFGSFWSTYPAYDLRPGAIMNPEFAHNEFLHVAFELGIPGLLCLLAFMVSLVGPLTTDRIVLIALAVESFFAFPLHLPATAAIAFLVSGHALRDRYLLRSLNPFRRRDSVNGVEVRVAGAGPTVYDTLPVRPSTGRIEGAG